LFKKVKILIIRYLDFGMILLGIKIGRRCLIISKKELE